MDFLTTRKNDLSDARTVHVSYDRDKVTINLGSVEACMSIKEARTLAAILLKNAFYAELHGLEEDQHPDAIASRNYMANAKRMREEGR